MTQIYIKTIICFHYFMNIKALVVTGTSPLLTTPDHDAKPLVKLQTMNTQKKPRYNSVLARLSSDSDRIRTYNRHSRNVVLYPIEPRSQSLCAVKLRLSLQKENYSLNI